MQKCLDLSRLPKAQGFKSVNLRHATPGSPLPLLIRAVPYNPTHAIDPLHPATRLSHSSFPSFSCPAFALRAVPKGALLRPEVERPSPMKLGRTTSNKEHSGGRARSVSLSLLFVISKKSTSKRAVVRHRLSTRMKSAVALVVTRGANAVFLDSKDGTIPIGSVPHRLSLVSSETHLTPSGLPWVLSDWTYVLTPTLIAYRMPLPELVLHVRAALDSINTQAHRLEAGWGRARKQMQPSDESPRNKNKEVCFAFESFDLPQPAYSAPQAPPLLVDQLMRLEELDGPLVPTDIPSLPRPTPRLFFPGMPAPPKNQTSSPPPLTRVKTTERLFSKRPVIMKELSDGEKRSGKGDR
ncbi:hypothetical protein BV22DRAFT_1003669 [Leucogyrophana mollusca]|uniref:Uncharacterized protein n=1 Tax=Leucogyrophana mollusca TaxID=85980 RepID=A0ACB8BU89_9AGAM|nr:hypothetical protein BV22DRAFT_1003669 [Leucogyrophana mollusca]